MSASGTPRAPERLVFRQRQGFEFAILEGMDRELELLSHEIFEKQPYTRHGISLADGACVVDLGANLGLFSVWCSQQARGLRIRACEPLPPLHRLAAHNLGRIEGHDIIVDHRGVAAERCFAELTFFPRATACSTRHAAETVSRMPTLYSDTQIPLLDLWSIHKGAFFLGLISGPFFPMLRRWVVRRVLQRALSQARRYRCELVTLSELIDDWKLDAIDLLKIDVQGSEVDVFLGLRDEHWARIHAIAMEVNTFLGRSQTTDICALLAQRGFRVVREDSPEIAAPGSFFVYAIREEGTR